MKICPWEGADNDGGSLMLMKPDSLPNDSMGVQGNVLFRVPVSACHLKNESPCRRNSKLCYLRSLTSEGRMGEISRLSESSCPIIGAVCCKISLVISMDESSESKSRDRMCSGVGIVTT